MCLNCASPEAPCGAWSRVYYLISTFSKPCYNSTPQSHLNPKKRHIDPPKVKKVKKSKKKSDFFFFWVPFYYKNIEKMFYQPQKVIFSPQKVKKVKKSKKKFFFLFFRILCKKHTVLIIFGFSPLPHL